MILKRAFPYAAGLSGVLLLFSLVSCGDAPTPVPTSTPQVTVIAATATPEQANAVVPAAQDVESGPSFTGKGDTLEISGKVQYQVCVGALCAPEGRRFALLTLQITNISQELLQVNTFYFDLLTTDQETAPDNPATYSARSPLPLVNLRPGTHTQGQIVFEIAHNARAATLIWDDYNEVLEIPITQ